MDGKLIKYQQIKQQYGINWTRQWLAILEAEGKFPRRVRLGQGAYWVRSEIEEYVANALSARSTVAATTDTAGRSTHGLNRGRTLATAAVQAASGA